MRVRVSDLRQELAVQQKPVQDRKSSLGSSITDAPPTSTSSPTAGLPTPPLTPPDKLTEDRHSPPSSHHAAAPPLRPPPSAESFDSVSRGEFYSSFIHLLFIFCFHLSVRGGFHSGGGSSPPLGQDLRPEHRRGAAEKSGGENHAGDL